MTANSQKLAPIRSLLARSSLRVRFKRALDRCMALAIPGALLLAATLLIQRFLPLPFHGLTWASAAALALPLSGLAWGVLLPVDRRKVATRLDTDAQLHDRLGTAWTITQGLRSLPSDGFPAAAVKDALLHWQQADPRSAIPIRLPSHSRAVGLALLALALAAWLQIPGAAPYAPLAERRHAAFFEEDELQHHRQGLERLKQTIDPLESPALQQIAARFEALLEALEGGKIDQAGAFERLHALEKELSKSGPHPRDNGHEEAAAQAAMQEAAKALKEEATTRPLGEALDKGQLDEARAALERLAKLLESGALPRAALEKLARSLEKAAKKMSAAHTEELRRRLSKELERLRNLRQKQGLTEREKERLSQLERRTNRLQRQQDKQAQAPAAESPERRSPSQPKTQEPQADRRNSAAGQQEKSRGRSRAVNRLARRMKQAAEQIRKPADSDAQQQAGQQLRKGVNEIKALHRSQRQAQARGQTGEKLAELKDSLRHGGRSKGRRLQKQTRRFRQRARGGKALQGGRRKAQAEQQRRGRHQGNIKRQGKGKGKGAGDQPDQGGLGSAEHIRSQRKEHFVPGKEGAGPILREVVLDAATKGFAARPYQRTFTRYQDIVEGELARERVPPGYRYYVKRYFQLIRPRQIVETPQGDSQ